MLNTLWRAFHFYRTYFRKSIQIIHSLLISTSHYVDDAWEYKTLQVSFPHMHPTPTKENNSEIGRLIGLQINLFSLDTKIAILT